MRQVIIEVPEGQGKKTLEILKEHQAANIAQLTGTGKEGPVEVVIGRVPNRSVESLIGELDKLQDLRVTLSPHGVMPLRPPSEKTAEDVTDVSMRSPIEIFLGGLQSIGSWTGFLGYAVAAGIVVWIGLTTNTVYLLVAAMLIAPYAGPVMNTAIATARGNGRLLAKSVFRYCAGLLVTAGVASLLSLLFGVESATSMMVDISQVSATAVLLPLAAGAAGAMNLIQSERDSLVSGAAVGILVAASLAPPAGLLGMVAVIGRIDMATNAIFVLLLQIAGINLAGSIVFRLYGLSWEGARYPPGSRWVFPFSIVCALVILGALVTSQLTGGPNLERSSIERRAETVTEEAIRSTRLAEPVEVKARFTRPRIRGQETLLVVIYAQRKQGVGISNDGIEAILARATRSYLDARRFQLTPVIHVNVVSP